MSITSMFEETKELSDLKAFCEAQQRTLVSLTKKIKELEDERDKLKALLDVNTPVVSTTPSTQTNLTEKLLSSDQETICRIQLTRLRDISLERELTLEETKKVEIFSKILAALENAPKTIKIDAKSVDSNDLMGLLEDSVSNNEQVK